MTFERTGSRHDMAARRARVARTVRLAPSVVRVTFTGDELSGLPAHGPEDHVKVFFPDPATGELHAPRMVDGALQRPTSGVSVSRDYTPRTLRLTANGTELDLELVLHGVAHDGAPAGPASSWAASAAEGDELVVAGPRGSRGVPAGIDRLVLVADETAMPAAARWIEQAPDDVALTVILDLADDDADAYVDAPAPDGGPSPFARASVERLYRADGPGQVDEAVRSLDLSGEATYVWAAGEATTLIAVRRYLRHELGLGAERVKVDGYWKRGVTNRDHHEPLDPSDPD
ncbi:siderophore-interacting protein [Luteimicrobium sp. DT211]|uniref:siderophore-interacting protein n=1 Tax=Luteimicrobium sp. DT211 TaxID=3393412 RepID=UPI003CFAD519